MLLCTHSCASKPVNTPIPCQSYNTNYLHPRANPIDIILLPITLCFRGEPCQLEDKNNDIQIHKMKFEYAHHLHTHTNTQPHIHKHTHTATHTHTQSLPFLTPYHTHTTHTHSCMVILVRVSISSKVSLMFINMEN